MWYSSNTTVSTNLDFKASMFLLYVSPLEVHRKVRKQRKWQVFSEMISESNLSDSVIVNEDHKNSLAGPFV